MAKLELVPEKLVQELAEIREAPPLRYVQSEVKRPIDASPPQVPVPVIDLRRLFRPDSDDEADKLKSALQSWGLFQAIGHEIPASLLDEVLNITREFFELPTEVKQKHSNLGGGEFSFEGYGTDQITAEDQILDWTDRLYLIVQPEDKRKLHFWPQSPSFRNVLNEFTIKARKVADHILEAMAKLLGLKEDYFINKFGDTGSVDARLNIYPSCSRPELVFGIKPHSDSSMITFILQDDVEGLQLIKDGAWVTVPTIPHALILVVGDQMEIMSNGIFIAPVHRVITNSEKERLSVALFYGLEPETDIEPVDGLADNQRPKSYKKVKAKDYGDFFLIHFAQGTRSIERVKI